MSDMAERKLSLIAIYANPKTPLAKKKDKNKHK